MSDKRAFNDTFTLIRELKTRCFDIFGNYFDRFNFYFTYI